MELDITLVALADAVVVVFVMYRTADHARDESNSICDEHPAFFSQHEDCIGVNHAGALARFEHEALGV